MLFKQPVLITKRGFSLVVLAIVIAIAGVLLISLIPVDSDRQAMQVKKTDASIETIIKALNSYHTINENLPCPADASIAVNDSNFGVAEINCDNQLSVGSVPTRTIGLADNYAFDKWGIRYTYAVKKDGSGANTILTVQDFSGNNIEDSDGNDPIGIVISHGPNTKGAVDRVGNAGVACPADTGQPSERGNCDYGTNPTPVFRKSEWNTTADNFYDDLMGIVFAPPANSSCPANIDGCLAWLKADAITGKSDGDYVSLWEDSSTNGNDANVIIPIHPAFAGGDFRPKYRINVINGLPTVRFDLEWPNWDSMDITFSTYPAGEDPATTKKKTLIVVMKRRTTDFSELFDSCPFRNAGDQTQGHCGVMKMRNTGAIWSRTNGNDTYILTGTYNADQFYVYTLLFDGVSGPGEAFQDGTSIGSWTAPAPYLPAPYENKLRIAGFDGDPWEGLDGDIAEMVVYSDILPVADREAIEDYLGTKYSISITH